MRRLRFCLVTTFYPPYNFGGDGIFVHRLANLLAEQGHDVHVIHDLDAFALLTDHKPKPSTSQHPNVILHPLFSRGAGPLDLLIGHQLGRPLLKRREIKIILDTTGFDVIHFHNISLLGGPHILKYGRAIKLCTMHDYWFVCAMHVLWRFDREVCTRRTCLECTSAGRRPPQLWRYDGSLQRSVGHVDAFISPSLSSQTLLKANGFPAPIRHIPYFMPNSEAQKWNDPPPDFGPPAARPYFLFVGRLEKIKGVQVLIELFKEYHEADLVIAGTGTYERALRAAAAGLSHVHFAGLLDHEQLRRLYSQTIAAIVPSLCLETFGWITLEAFAMHTPVIVSDKGALPEVVSAGGGLVYRSTADLRAAMESLRTQPEQRQLLAEQGYRNYLDHYTEERFLESYYGLIDEIDAQPGRKSKGRP